MSSARGALLGLVLALGAPLGWLTIRYLDSGAPGARWLVDELRWDWGLYTYLLLATATFFVLFGSLLGAQIRRQERTALADPLTGLPNRRAFVPAVAAALGREGAAVLLVDLDRFKRVNDERGHAAGDALLVATAQALTAALRTGDTCARIGGDEFAVLLPGTSAVTAYAVAERLLARLRPVLAAAHPDCSASVGVASLPRGGKPDELLALSDAAMYRAKAERGRVSA